MKKIMMVLLSTFFVVTTGVAGAEEICGTHVNSYDGSRYFENGKYIKVTLDDRDVVTFQFKKEFGDDVIEKYTFQIKMDDFKGFIEEKAKSRLGITMLFSSKYQVLDKVYKKLRSCKREEVEGRVLHQDIENILEETIAGDLSELKL